MRVLLIILIITTIYVFINTNSVGKWNVYGPKKCGWTLKQLDHMMNRQINHKFIDCDKNDCSGINGFPTLKHDDGRKIVGFSNNI